MNLADKLKKDIEKELKNRLPVLMKRFTPTEKQLSQLKSRDSEFKGVSRISNSEITL